MSDVNQVTNQLKSRVNQVASHVLNQITYFDDTTIKNSTTIGKIIHKSYKLQVNPFASFVVSQVVIFVTYFDIQKLHKQMKDYAQAIAFGVS